MSGERKKGERRQAAAETKEAAPVRDHVMPTDERPFAGKGALNNSSPLRVYYLRPQAAAQPKVTKRIAGPVTN